MESSGTEWLCVQADRGRFVGDPPSVTSICYIRGCLHKTTYFRIPKPKKGIHFFTAKETWYSSSPEYNQTLALNPFKTPQV